MSKKILLALLVVVGGIFYVGCAVTQQPVYNINNAFVGGGEKLTQSQVEQSIIKAGASLGWRMNKVKDGLIIGTLNVRTHMAVIEIKYNTSTYNISYKDSANLDYDGSKIHKNYNGWIQRLDTAIHNNLLVY